MRTSSALFYIKRSTLFSRKNVSFVLKRCTIRFGDYICKVSNDYFNTQRLPLPLLLNYLSLFLAHIGYFMYLCGVKSVKIRVVIIQWGVLPRRVVVCVL